MKKMALKKFQRGLKMEEIIGKVEIVVLGGVGFNSYRNFEVLSVQTPYGKVTAYHNTIRGKKIAIIPRHSGKNHIPPHRINYRANIWAIHALGAKRVISTNSVGSMREHPVGSFVVIDDFIDFTRNRSSTFYDDTTVHIDVSEPYCTEIRTALIKALEKADISLH